MQALYKLGSFLGREAFGQRKKASDSRWLLCEVIAMCVCYNRAVGRDPFLYEENWRAVVKNRTTNFAKFANPLHFVREKTA